MSCRAKRSHLISWYAFLLYDRSLQLKEVEVNMLIGYCHAVSNTRTEAQTACQLSMAAIYRPRGRHVDRRFLRIS
jgi:hypothetical protein